MYVDVIILDLTSNNDRIILCYEASRIKLPNYRDHLDQAQLSKEWLLCLLTNRLDELLLLMGCDEIADNHEDWSISSTVGILTGGGGGMLSTKDDVALVTRTLSASRRSFLARAF